MNSTTNNTETLKHILKSKLDNLTITSKDVISLKDAPQCTYQNLKGVRCTTKCINTCNDPHPKCYAHINRKEVVQCTYVCKDVNGCEERCDKLTRSAKGYCHYHSVMIYNNMKAKAYYQAHKEKIRESTKIINLINKLDKITTQIDDIIYVE